VFGSGRPRRRRHARGERGPAQHLSHRRLFSGRLRDRGRDALRPGGRGPRRARVPPLRRPGACLVPRLRAADFRRLPPARGAFHRLRLDQRGGA
ncbi:MAG: DNA-damage-inducible protein F, partial [uncultured Microvirga sp.]